MCRHAAYIGPGIAVTELTHDLPHSLHQQSFRARELLTGSVCADGFGAAWFPGTGDGVAARYASPMPIWSDTNLPSIGPATRAGVVLAWIRNATIAGGNHDANTQPFTGDGGALTFTHNGYLEQFETDWLDWFLDEALDADARRDVRGDTDSSYIFALLRQRRRLAGDDEALGVSVQWLLRELRRHGDAIGRLAQLNLLVADADQVVATRCGTKGAQNSLYWLRDGDEFPDGTVVASEPLYDDPAWQVVPADTVLVLQRDAPAVHLPA